MATEQFNRPDSPASSSISASLPSSMPSSIHASLEVDSSVCSTEANQPIHQSDLIEASKEAKEVFIGSVQCQNNVTDNNSKSSLSNGLSTTSQDDKNVNDTMSDTSSIDTLQLHPRLAVCDSFTLNDFYRLAVKFYKGTFYFLLIMFCIIFKY